MIWRQYNDGSDGEIAVVGVVEMCVHWAYVDVITLLFFFYMEPQLCTTTDTVSTTHEYQISNFALRYCAHSCKIYYRKYTNH